MDRSDLAVLGRLLADPTRPDELGELAIDRVPDLIKVARLHGVEAWLAEYAPDTSAWQPVREQRARFLAAALRNRQLLHEFGELAERADCRWVAIKGQAVAEDLYPAKHCRYGVDVDVLVDPERFADLLSTLLAGGWRLLDRNWPLPAATMPGQLRLLSPVGGLLDLHWHLMNNPRLRKDFALPTEQLLARRRSLPSGLPALSSDDQLVHLALHAALSGGNRLSWLTDVGYAARRVVDWGTLGRRSRQAGAGPALGLMLVRSHRWLDTPAPAAGLAHAGASASWRLLCRQVDNRYPIQLDPSAPGVQRALARSVRASLPASVAEVAGHGVAWLRRGASSEPAAGICEDFSDPASPLFVVEDGASRQRYLQASAAG